MSGHRDPKLMAIKLGKQGDLTGSDAIAWSHTRGVPYTASPVLYDNKLYVVTDNGMVSAFNATTGEPFYAQTRLPKGYNLKASPVGANGNPSARGGSRTTSGAASGWRLPLPS